MFLILFEIIKLLVLHSWFSLLHNQHVPTTFAETSTHTHTHKAAEGLFLWMKCVYRWWIPHCFHFLLPFQQIAFTQVLPRADITELGGKSTVEAMGTCPEGTITHSVTTVYTLSLINWPLKYSFGIWQFASLIF